MASGKRLCPKEIEIILESDSEAFSEENVSQDDEEEQEEKDHHQQQPASDWLDLATSQSGL
jgi:hypothetical protein